MRRTRPLALTLTGALVAGTLGALLPAGSAQAATTDPTPAKLNAAWMVSNLKDGLLETVGFGAATATPNYNATLDLAEGLRAVGTEPAALARIDAALAAGIGTWTADGTKGTTARALAHATAGGGSTTVGGLDLVAKVEALVADTGAHVGWVNDSAEYLNTWTQIWATRGLLAAGSPEAEAAVDRLAKQQCEDGSFRDGQSLVETSWSSIDPEECTTPSSSNTTDAAALAVINLHGFRSNPKVATMLGEAATYIKGKQAADGSYSAGSLGVNVNSTGLAGTALGLLGEGVAAQKAASWLRGLQVVGACDGKMAAETGAVAYNAKSLEEGRTHGITDVRDRSEWITADAQALPALLAAPANAATDAVSLPRFAKVGSTATWTVEGLAAGERACLRGLNGTDTRTVVGTGAPLTGTITVAAGAQGLSLTTATTTATGVVTGLAPTTLKVKAKKKVKRGARLKVTVKGLVEGERVLVKVGKKKAKGTASANGTFTKKFRAPAKRGKATIKVTGEFADRKGTKKVRVR